MIKKNNKKGLSAIVATLIMVLLVVVSIGILWSFINNVIQEPIANVESCFNTFEKVTLNNQYTCYNTTSNVNELLVSVNVKDIDIDGFFVAISAEGESKSFEIKNNLTSQNIRKYKGTYGSTINPPGENSGSTYVFNLTGLGLGKPDSVSVYPVVNGKLCESYDSISEIDSCLYLA